MIYFLEDDNNIRNFVIYALNNTGLSATGFGTPSEFWEAMKTEKPELLLLDIMLPEEDGISILKKLRSKSDTKDLPVIMLTAKGTEYDKVVGLDTGADDYVAKPFGTNGTDFRGSRRCCVVPTGGICIRNTAEEIFIFVLQSISSASMEGI